MDPFLLGVTGDTTLATYNGRALLPIPDPRRTELSALPSTTGRLFSTSSFDQYFGIDQYLRLIS